MQILDNNSQRMQSLSLSDVFPLGDRQDNMPLKDNKSLLLNAVYTQLFKENRNLSFHHNASLESAYLNGKINTRELVEELLCSDMYVNYIFANNSNFRFVELCFERVLGRKATQKEIQSWSSLVATEGIKSFAQQLTNCDEYMAAFGDGIVPYRRSRQLSSSNQGLPALPKELSLKRYQGEGNWSQYYGGSSLPPEPIRRIGAVLVVAGGIEVIRILVTIAWAAFQTGS